nr:hypothetical protein [Pandoravirus aubagnensis]
MPEDATLSKPACSLPLCVPFGLSLFFFFFLLMGLVQRGKGIVQPTICERLSMKWQRARIGQTTAHADTVIRHELKTLSSTNGLSCIFFPRRISTCQPAARCRQGPFFSSGRKKKACADRAKKSTGT